MVDVLLVQSEEAKEILDADTDVDESEKEYLLEYYSLVREGKTNYVSTLAFYAITGEQPTEPPDFFKIYDSEFKSKRYVRMSLKFCTSLWRITARRRLGKWKTDRRGSAIPFGWLCGLKGSGRRLLIW